MDDTHTLAPGDSIMIEADPLPLREIQAVFAEFGPEDERMCDWWRTMEEPWASLARVFGLA